MAILDIVSRKWLGTVVSAEESSTQVEVALTAALQAEDCWTWPTSAPPPHCGQRWHPATATGSPK